MMILFRLIFVLLALPFTKVFSFSERGTTIFKSNNEQEMLSFEAISDGKKVIVNWTSYGEKTFDYYTVEKSKDGINFYPALMVKSAGKSTNLFEYTDIDYSPFTGVSYYRLRQNDYFGEYSYSSTIVVNCQLLKDGSVVPLNGNAGTLKELREMEGKPVLVVVRDSKGKEFISKILVTSQNEVIYASDVKNQLIQGDYVVVASSCNPLYHQKLIVK